MFLIMSYANQQLSILSLLFVPCSTESKTECKAFAILNNGQLTLSLNFFLAESQNLWNCSMSF